MEKVKGDIKLQENVDLVKLGDKDIYLVGTAHISTVSADLAEQVIREVKPDSVAVELCESRYHSLKDPERWKNTDIISVIKAGRIYVLLAQLLLASFQKRIGKELEMQPGAEMMRAVRVADEIGANTVLADRDVRLTLKRVWGNVGFIGGVKIILSLLTAFLSKEKVSSEEIEKLKDEDSLNSALKEFSEKLPKVKEPLIDERDEYLAAKIAAAPGSTIVAIIGAGHIPGIKKYLGKETDFVKLERIPPRGILVRSFAWAVPALIIGIVAYGFFYAGAQTSLSMLEAWFWITGFMGALGAALAIAHPLTIIIAFLATPLATLHPLIAAGWIAGLVEAFLRKPRVSDFERITDDIASIKGIWTNRVSRIILVIGLTNIFSTIGMLWGAKVLANLAIIGDK